MPDRYQESHIRQIPMFSHLSEYHFQLIARAFEVRRYNPGDYVLIQATEVPGLMIVADGQLLKIKVEADNTITRHGSVVDGQALYLEALFGVVPAQTHLQVIRPTNILMLTRTAFATLVAHHPDLQIALNATQQQKKSPPTAAPATPAKKPAFKGQNEGEKVLRNTRRHWFSMMRWMWAPVVILIFGFIFAAGVPQIAIIVLPLAMIFGLSGATYIVLEWANDSVIVTNQRIIHKTQTILTFSEKRDEVPLDSIQEANAEIPGFDLFARILKYGDVELKTAGAKGNFTLDFMPDPEGLQKLILEDAREFQVNKHARQRQTMIADIERWKDEPYQAKDIPMPKAKTKNAASESKLKNIYSTGDGPISPFVLSFPTSTGGVVYRKHWFVWMRAIALPALLLIGTLVAMVLLLFPPFSSIGLIGWVSVFVTFLGGVSWLYISDWDWRHDYYLITDNDITIIKQRPLWLSSEQDRVLLKQVHNVIAETNGIFQQVFRYGNLKVALVGADDHKIFDNIAKPGDVQSEINRRQQRMKQKESEAASRARRDEIGEYLSLYHHSQPDSDSDTGPMYPVDKQLPYEPRFQSGSPTPSPFGQQRPSMSQGRPYTPSPQPPPSRSNQGARVDWQNPQQQQFNQHYTPSQGIPPVDPNQVAFNQGYTPPPAQQNPYQGGQQGQYPQQGNQMPYQPGQQGQYPQQGNQMPYQGGQQGQYPQQGNQMPYQPGQQGQYPQQGNQMPYQPGQQGQYPQQGNQMPYQPGQQGQYPQQANQMPYQDAQGNSPEQGQNRPPIPPFAPGRNSKFPKNRNS